MVSANLVAAFLVLAPAMGILGWLLTRYEDYFVQSRLFFVLGIGLVAGIGLRYVELALFGFESTVMVATAGWIFSLLYTAFGYGLLEALAQQAVLGFRKFRGRKDTPYYGAALGVGFGAMWALQFATELLKPVTEPALVVSAVTAAKSLEAILFGLGLVLAHAAAAIQIGKGSAEGQLLRGAFRGALLLAPSLALYWSVLNAWGGLLPAIAAFAYGAVILWPARKVLDNIVPPEIRDQVRKERRRAARAK